VPAVFEGKDCLPEDAVVVSPHHGAGLWRSGGDALETRLGLAVRRNTAARTARSGHGDQSRPARRTESPIIAGENALAGHAQSRQQDLKKSGPQRLHSQPHGPNPSPFSSRIGAFRQSRRQISDFLVRCT
jgi:hypothetical protein